jgi:hypothetical protein
MVKIKETLPQLHHHILLTIEGQRVTMEDAVMLYQKRHPPSLVKMTLRQKLVRLLKWHVPKHSVERAILALVESEYIGTELTRIYNGNPLPRDTILYSLSSKGSQFLISRGKR